MSLKPLEPPVTDGQFPFPLTECYFSALAAVSFNPGDGNHPHPGFTPAENSILVLHIPTSDLWVLSGHGRNLTFVRVLDGGDPGDRREQLDAFIAHAELYCGLHGATVIDVESRILKQPTAEQQERMQAWTRELLEKERLVKELAV
jgi:hypothetical protein